jgi:putative membrane protein
VPHDAHLNYQSKTPLEKLMTSPSTTNPKPTNADTVTRSPRAYLLLYLKGILMGSADVIPGVSGGTVALLVGIYEELINSISRFTETHVWHSLRRGDVRTLFVQLPWRFLGVLFLGIMTAVLSLAHVLEDLLEHYPVAVWSVFFGLIAASVVSVRTRVNRWHLPTYGAFAAGAMLAFGLVGLSPTNSPTAWWFLVVSGFIAVCALILPGISGAFILVLLGKYERILAAVTDLDIFVLVCVASGAVLGLLSIARLLRWTLARYHDLTIALLCGFMLGSLRKVWPWQQLDSRGLLVNIAPPSPSDAFTALALAGLAFVMVLSLEHLTSHRALSAGSSSEQA